MRLAVAAATLWAISAAGAAAAAIAPSTDPATVKAGTYKLDPDHGKITWSVSHLGFSTYVGQFGHVTATFLLAPELAQSRLTATVDMNSIGTLNPALDKVLKGDGFFDVAKYPIASFTSTRFLRTGKMTANVDGKLTLHGVTKPVLLQVTFNQAGFTPMDGGYIAGFTGTATVKRSDFGMGAYTAYISDNIPLQIEAEFHPQ